MTLDWRYGHWKKYFAPCRHCGFATQLRDDEHKPSHKVCAEAALAKKIGK